ncbi:hypothetical protein [Motiliproteus sp. MSK22-1]|uniref:hypothetical protein n=1 Tax=Motiliproteus sp. MSK22-1 TaxID=1897630 RepID=UPI0009758464|nr:hypothetical protein [Motiliproteus sp. MSK22-1]OMH36275.1 hypothetical protein BGP75_10040 [Motiliproteus sp. MSK22-1]
MSDKKTFLFAELKDDEQRSAYRIEPDSEHPLELLIGEQSIPVVNLSSNGLAFYLGELIDHEKELLLQPDQQLEIQILLGASTNDTIVATIEILQRQQDFYRCRLITNHQAHKKLCQYIVDQQKQLIRERKDQSRKNRSDLDNNENDN